MDWDELKAELEALEKPRAEFGSMQKMKASMEELRLWKEQHPEKQKRYEEIHSEMNRIEQQWEEVRRAERVLNKLKSAGVGERTIESMSVLKETAAVVAVREWTPNPTTWLLLAGSVGTGKTVAAAWCLKTMADLDRSVAFTRAGELARLSGFDEGARQLSRLKEVRYLVVDDLGTECANQWGQSILHELFDHRHEAKLKTIITSNLKRTDARARLGDRMSDRVQGDGKIAWLEGKSLRQNRDL